MRPRALVVLNPRSRQGTGAVRFARVRPVVEARFDTTLVELDADGDWREALSAALRNDVRVFIAAGGDGTVSSLADALAGRRGGRALETLTLGAVGLGSSNDFLKPVRHTIHGIPVRLDERLAAPRDLVCAEYEDDRGRVRVRRFVTSASLGLSARANAFFNDGDVLVRALKSHWTGGAILYAVLREIARASATSATLRFGEGRFEARLLNLSVMKTAHLSGGLAYDTPVDPADGLLAVNSVDWRGRAAAVAAFWRLARGRFVGLPGARHWSNARLDVALPAPAPLELDGEVVSARRVRFEVLPERIRVCA